MIQKRQMLGIAFMIGLITASSLYFMKPSVPKNTDVKAVVSVSTFPLWEVARVVAGDSLEIRSIVPLGGDAHMFSPNPTQVAELSASQMFIYSGAGFEAWAEGTKNILPSTIRVVDMSRHVCLIRSEEDHHEDEHHDHGAFDPHYWLDIDNMIRMTQTMEKEFSHRFPEHKGVFERNARMYIGELTQLKSEFTTGLAECKNRTLVSNHDAFGYLAHANRLENVSVIGLSSDEQPSAHMIANVVQTIKEHQTKTIFFEALINDHVSQTIAEETGVKVLPLQPLENISEDELQSHQTYLSIMRENLKKLREAMECR